MVVIVLCICSTQWHHVSFWFMFNKHIYEYEYGPSLHDDKIMFKSLDIKSPFL